MLQNTRTPLDGGWKLRYVENKRFRKENKDISTIAALKLTGWQSVDAVVPGNFELDFERAGLISDPFFGCNTIENEKFENLHLVYSRRFTLENEPDENTFLVFEGIDTVADIFVNGKLIGQTDNMLIPFEFARANLKKGENEIIVPIWEGRREQRQHPRRHRREGIRGSGHLHASGSRLRFTLHP